MAIAPRRIEEILRDVPLFAGLGERGVARFARRGVVVEATRGSVIFRKGDPSSALHVVAHGQVKLSFQNGSGDEKIVELIGAGSTFGEACLLLGESYLVTAEAISRTRLVQLPKETVLDEIRHNPEFSRGVIGALSRRLYERMRDLENCMLRSGTQRVIAFLLNQVPDGAGDRGVAVTLPAQKRIIASRLNLTNEHFSRILRALTGGALIEVDGRSVRIPDLRRLRICSAH
ncbi:MAG: Crp/Fnr family transcriptional regulator [Betaproteobacteria bacterium]|nr:Crp/Fnr family transcriptional regulator [Betaproteobacteria bacterium]